MTPQDIDKPRVNPTTVWALIIFVVLSMVVGWNMLVGLLQPKPLSKRLEAFTEAVEKSKVEAQLGRLLKDGTHSAEVDAIIAKYLSNEELSQSSETLLDWLNRHRLPYLSRLEKNIALTERSGKEVELKELKGKVIVACWVFTRCPRGCTGVAGEMRKIFTEFQGNPNIHFLSVSVDPDDKPEDLKRFADGLALTGDNWWFVNGPKDQLRTYMTRYFGFNDVQEVPVADRMSPDDKYVHDMRVALVDSRGHVRGFYGIANPDPEFANFYRQKIREDIKTLLNEKEASELSPPPSP